MTQVIMAIDPGVSTGMAFALQRDDGTWQYSTATATHPHEVWAFIASPVTTVIIEQFAARLIDTYGLHTVEVVGGACALAWKHDIPIVRQTPQNRRPYLTMARRMVNRPGRTRHEVDAMAQLLCFMRRQNLLEVDR